MIGSSNEESVRREVARAWDSYWKSHVGELEGPPMPFIVKALHGAVGVVRGKRVLEAGSGTGALSQTLAHAGARVTLLDFVPRCVRVGLRALGMSGVAGDLFQMPFSSGSFDVVFNHGVMEHFEPASILRGIGEMARVLKPGGKLLVMVPSARGRFYVAGKKSLEREGRWEYGIEYPQPSLAAFGAALGLESLGESWTGVRHQANFLSGWRRKVARLVTRPFSEDSRLGVALFGAYLQVSLWRKPDHGATQ